MRVAGNLNASAVNARMHKSRLTTKVGIIDRRCGMVDVMQSSYSLFMCYVLTLDEQSVLCRPSQKFVCAASEMRKLSKILRGSPVNTFQIRRDRRMR
jgi:hypothetical protein